MKKVAVSAVLTAIAVAIVNYIFCIRPIRKDLDKRFGAMQFLSDIKKPNRKYAKVVRQ